MDGSLARDIALVVGIALIAAAGNALIKVTAAHSSSRAFQSFAALT